LITGQTVRFLEQHRDEPFALWISYPDPHEPWVAPAHYAARFPPEKVALPPRQADEFAEGQAPERNRILYRMLGYDEDRVEDVLALMSVYYGMVKFLDDGVGQILDALERLGLREETILVYCSDHGDFMGEHGMQCKGGAFYDCLTRVPLIVSWPGQTPQNWREASMVSLVDVIPTVLELQGMEAPTEMQGQHLPGVCAGAARREAAFAEYGAGGPPFTMADLDRLPRPHGRQTLLASLHWREAEGRRKMVRTHDWKYVHDPMGDLDELYDLNADPGELHNLAGDRGHEAVVSAMRCRLADWMIQTEDATPVPLPAPRIQSR
jgi:arylsulfatase A-like enzyme